MSSRGHSRALRAGYTLVEVMMALALFTIAMLGIISMQKVTVVSNKHAKNLAMAQRIAQSWLAQLELDSTLWRNDMTATNFITAGNVDAGWLRPAYVGAMQFGAAFDAAGRPLADTAPALANAHFCTHVRLSTVFPANAPVSGNGLLRAEVRVFWLRDDEALDPPNVSLCALTLNPTTLGAATDRFHFVYQTSGVRQQSSI
jgi:type IV pilus assembly protein PilV